MFEQPERGFVTGGRYLWFDDASPSPAAPASDPPEGG